MTDALVLRRDGCGPEIHAMPERAEWNADLFCPCTQRHRPAVDGHESSAPRVSVLNVDRCPPHVTRLVITVVVDPVERMGGRGARPQVGVKALKGLAPLRADDDPASAVVSVLPVPLVQAAGLHVAPRARFRRPRETMLREYPDSTLPLVAAARPDVARAQATSTDRFESAAVAAALPLRAPSHSASGKPKHGQAAVSLVGQLHYLRTRSERHRADYIARRRQC